MAREIRFNKWYHAIINPVGFVADRMRSQTGGDANNRVQDWLKSDISNIPLGCAVNELGGCSFNGTAADFEEYRQQWILNCKNANVTSILHSNNKTLSECETVFDEYTKDIQFAQYAQNASDFETLKSKISDNQKYIIIAVVGVLLLALIVYLLTSK